MSLLLDALKQAEKAREGGTSPASAATKENNNLIEMDREPTSPDKVTPIPDSPSSNQAIRSNLLDNPIPAKEVDQVADPHTVTTIADAQNLFQAGATSNQPKKKPNLLFTLITVLFILLFVAIFALYSYLTGDSVITAQALQRSVSVKTKPEVRNLIPIAEPLIAVAREAIELYPPTTLANQELVAERNPLPTDLLTGSAEAGNSYTDNSQPGVTAVKFTRKIVSNQLQQKLQKANQALAENDSQQAKSLYRSMLTGGTEDKQARFGLAAIAINQQQFEEAQAHYRWILNIEPNNPFALAGLAEARTENSPQQKEAILKQQLAQQGEAHFLHYALGNSYVAQQRWGEAQQAYFKAFDLDPSNAVYAYNLAISLEQLQQTRSALGFYRRALQLIRAEDPLDRTVLSQRISQLEAK